VPAQVLQAPQLADPQQVPLTQFPLVHSLAPMQEPPLAFFAPQAPPEQIFPAAQSLSFWQLTLQPLVVQA
jgi:hypothetical protein